MPAPGIHDDIGIASADEGLVILDGPNGIAVTLTPDAAERTGEALIRASHEARGQSASGLHPGHG